MELTLSNPALGAGPAGGRVVVGSVHSVAVSTQEGLSEEVPYIFAQEPFVQYVPKGWG